MRPPGWNHGLWAFKLTTAGARVNIIMDPPPPSPTLASCATCRATGTVTFGGIALYLLHVRSGAATVAHARVLAAMAAASAAAAVARWRAG